MKYKILQKLLYLSVCLFFFIVGHFSASKISADSHITVPADPESLEANPPIELYGVTCGLAEDPVKNKCCLNESTIQMDPLDIANEYVEVSNKIAIVTDPPTELTSEDLDRIRLAIEVADPPNPEEFYDIAVNIYENETVSESDRADLRDVVDYGYRAMILEVTDEKIGPAKLMMRRMFTPDRCVMKNRIVKLCIRGTMEFFGNLVDSTGVTGGLYEVKERSQSKECAIGDPEINPATNACTCATDDDPTAICRRYIDSNEVERCENCIENQGGFWTGMGCIGTDPGSFAQSLIGYGLSIGGATALLCIFYAAFILQTSRGNPERIKKAKENLRACITGLLVIIFSILIVRVIGIDLLRIPGFN